MTLEEASHLAHKKANEFRLPMIVVKDDLSEETEGRNVGRSWGGVSRGDEWLNEHAVS